MNRFKIILNYLLGFILCILITLLVTILILKYSIYNDKYLKRVLVNNDYYTKVYNESLEEMKDYMISSGLEEEVLNDIYSKETVKNDIDNYIDNYYKGKVIEINTEDIKSKLTKNINSYLKNQNVDVTNREELNLFIEDIGNIYSKEIKVYNYLDKVINIFNKVGSLLNKIIIIDTLLLIIVICLMKFKISSGIMASGITLLFIRFTTYDSLDASNVEIITSSFSEVFRSVFYSIGNMILIVSICLIVIGLIINIIESIDYKKEKKSKKKKGVVKKWKK